MEEKILEAYMKWRVSLGKPSAGPEDIKQSVVFGAFKAGYLEGLGGEQGEEESDLDDLLGL